MRRADTVPRDSDSLGRQAALASSLAALGLLGAATAVRATGVAGDWYVPLTLGVFCCALLVASTWLPDHRPHRRLGHANHVTLLRLSITALLAGLVIERVDALAWFAAAAAGVAALLDALDGWLARRSGMASAFGARFDMETDALLILVLAALVWKMDKAGAWVLASGLLRYGFVAAGRLWPVLGRPLPPSRRRKAACAVQVVALVVCLVPIVPSAMATAIAASALALLAASFAADLAWLMRARRTRPQECLP